MDRINATVSLSPIEMVALKKLAIVSHALAARLDGTAAREQACLASTLDDLLRQIEINHAAGRAA